jgi:chemotaxis protein CheC
MEDVRNLKALQLDALREVANIGAGHAATALSQLTDRTIMISVPEISVSRLEDVPDLVGDVDEPIVAILMHMLGDLTGRTLLFMPEADARVLCDLIHKREIGTTVAFGEFEESSLREAANILAGAYLSALAEFLGMMLLPSVPSLVIDLAGAVLTTTYLNFGQDRDFVLCVHTDLEFRDERRQLSAHFLLLPDVASLKAIFDAVRLD